MANQEIAETTVKPLRAIPKNATPLQLIQAAYQDRAPVEYMKELMALQERYEANEARKAYNEAIAAFKANPPRVTKDKVNKQYDSRYTSIGNLVNTVNTELSKYDLNVRWDIDQSVQGVIKVTCILSHAMGHSEQTSLSAPPDTSGQKNPIQQIKSTVTYLEIATYQAITGIASDEANLDDDGNSAGNRKPEKPKTLPIYPDDLFAKNFPKWQELIASGKKPVNNIIATVSSKYRLTGDQLKELNEATNPVPTDKDWGDAYDAEQNKEATQ